MVVTFTLKRNGQPVSFNSEEVVTWNVDDGGQGTCLVCAGGWVRKVVESYQFVTQQLQILNRAPKKK
jgi:hypothetical protein